MRGRLLIPLVLVLSAVVLGVLPSATAGIAVKLPTWTGVDVGRFTVAVVASDLNGDGRQDLAWGRDDFFQDSITVQLSGPNGRLGAPHTYPAALDVQDIAAGDLNGDGRRDLVAVSQGADGASHTIDLYLNTGTGSFTHTTRTGGNGASRVVVADLNGDGMQDLALTNLGFSVGNTLGVMLGHGDGTFDTEVRYTIGSGVYGVAAADLNADGALDLAVGWSSGQGTDYHVAVLRNNGSGTFTLGATLNVPTSDGFTPFWPSVAAADFDGDGRVDLSATSGGTLHLAVFRNLGNLSFSPPTIYPAGGGPTRLLALDIGSDGRPDLVEAAPGDSFAGHLVVLRNLGNGTFGSPVRIEAGPQPYGVAVADMNGDRRVDLIGANRGSGTGTIDPQMSDGTFAAPPIYEAAADLLPIDTATGDFDGDGHPDMALSELDYTSQAQDVVAIMHNDGRGHFALQQQLPSGTDAHAKSVIAADLNGDGKDDLAWTPEIFNVANYPLEVALNTGNGTFAQPVSYPLGTCGTGEVTAGDVNGDGHLDLIVANDRGGPGVCEGYGRTVRVVLGNGNGTFAPDFGVQIGMLTEMAVAADVNGDGRADIVSSGALTHVALALPGGGFAAPVTYQARGTELAAADMNGDGHPDIVTADGSTAALYVLRNSGTGSFTVQRYQGEEVNGLMNGQALAIGDINRDGLLDVAVANPSGQNAAVFYGRAGGQLGPEMRYGTRSDFGDVNIADYNGDGRLDLAGPGGIEEQGIALEHPGVTVLLDIAAPCVSTACAEPLG
jgi:hypothetical protein